MPSSLPDRPTKCGIFYPIPPEILVRVCVDAGGGVRSRSQLIERKIEVLEDMATKVTKLVIILILIAVAFY